MKSRSVFARMKMSIFVVLLSVAYLGTAFAGVIASDEDGNLWIWSDEEKADITYYFVGDMTLRGFSKVYLTHDEVVAAFKAAAAEWEAAVPAVGFSFRDVTGTPEEADAMFPISIQGSGGYWNAQGFWPHSDRDPHLWVDTTAWIKYDTPEKIEGLFWHELGHILGLFHEDQTNGLRVGESDADSIMDDNVSPNYYQRGISDGDIATLEYAYTQAYRGTYGDVNLDGTVDIDDALLVAHYYIGDDVGDDFVLEAADVNIDDVVDIEDALIIAQYCDELVPLPYAP